MKREDFIGARPPPGPQRRAPSRHSQLPRILLRIYFAAGVLLGLIVAGLAVWVSIRCLLTPVVIAVEGARHPLAVLRRSWDLTRGNAGRITLFAIVLALAVSVLAAVASALTGIVLALVGGPAVGRIAGDAAVALVGAAAATYFAISFAAIHRQLAGTARTDPAVFE